MKRIITIVLLIVTLCSVFAINTSAESDFTQADAEKLAFEAYKIGMILFQGGYVNTINGDLGNKIFVLNNSEPNSKIEFYEVFKSSSEGVAYDSDRAIEKGIGYTKVDTTENSGYTLKTMDDVNNLLKKVFTDDEAKRHLYTELEGSPSKMKLEKFRIAGDGTLLMDCGGFGVQSAPSYSIRKINDLTVNGNKALLTIEIQHSVSAPPASIYRETVEFEKTADGWRVSGGTMTQVFRGEINPVEITNTFDPTPIYLTAIALIALAAPLVVKRRREA